MKCLAIAFTCVVVMVAGPRSLAATSEPGKLEGWLRSSAEGRVTRAGFHEKTPDVYDVPADRLVARQLVLLRYRYTRGGTFSTIVSGLLDVAGYQSDAPLDRAWYVLNGASGSTEVDATLREAYAGFYRPRFDLRLGLQRVAWGHADVNSPNDVVNARNSRDPVLTETELRYRPTPLARLDVPLPFATVQMVVAPLFQKDSYDVYGRNWALVQSEAPAGYRGVLGAIVRASDRSAKEAARTLFPDQGSPHDRLSGSEAGVRVDWRLGRFDVTHYYQYGWNGVPSFRIASDLRDTLNAIDWNAAPPGRVAAVLAQASVPGAVRSTWERRHHVGLDLGTTCGPLALRLDVAYEDRAVLYDRQLSGWLSPTVNAVLGAECQPGVLELLEVEAGYQRVIDAPPRPGLLFLERSSAMVATLARVRLSAAFEFETRGQAGITPRFHVLRPQLSYTRDRATVRLGAVLVNGESGTFGGWYRENRSAYAMLKVAY